MTDGVHWLLRIFAYSGFAGAIGYFSMLPTYDYASADMTEIKVSVSHAAERVEPCIQLTPQEIAKLPPNMRRTELCTRERRPVSIRIEMDGEIILDTEAPPSGLWRDGSASIYERFPVEPGFHRLTAMLRDSGRQQGWDYTRTEDVSLVAGKYFTVTFRKETGGFKFR